MPFIKLLYDNTVLKWWSKTSTMNHGLLTLRFTPEKVTCIPKICLYIKMITWCLYVDIKVQAINDNVHAHFLCFWGSLTLRSLRAGTNHMAIATNNKYHGNPQPSFFGVITHIFWGVKPSFFMVLGSKGTLWVFEQNDQISFSKSLCHLRSCWLPESVAGHMGPYLRRMEFHDTTKSLVWLAATSTGIPHDHKDTCNICMIMAYFHNRKCLYLP